MRKTSKSTIVSKLIVPYGRNAPVDIQLVDGNDLRYHTTWPKMRTTVAFNNLVTAAEDHSPMCVVLDKYKEGAIKSQERERRT